MDGRPTNGIQRMDAAGDSCSAATPRGNVAGLFSAVSTFGSYGDCQLSYLYGMKHRNSGQISESANHRPWMRKCKLHWKRISGSAIPQFIGCSQQSQTVKTCTHL